MVVVVMRVGIVGGGVVMSGFSGVGDGLVSGMSGVAESELKVYS